MESQINKDDAETIFYLIVTALQDIADADGSHPDEILDDNVIDLLKRISIMHPIMEDRIQSVLDEKIKKNIIPPSIIDVL